MHSHTSADPVSFRQGVASAFLYLAPARPLVLDPRLSTTHLRVLASSGSACVPGALTSGPRLLVEL
eukprot:3467499-Rhodomonas_salina.3